MTDPIHEQISSFLDGELPVAESELLLKRLERDAQLRNTVGRYALIGEALRSTEAGGPTRDFAARVSRAIEQESAPGRAWRPVANWLKPVAGGAIAAGVAAVALVTLRIAPVAEPVESAAAREPAAAPLLVSAVPEPSADAMPSYTVPMSKANFPPPPIQVVNNGRLANFVMAHSEYSTPLGRRNVLTGLLAEEAIDQNDAADAPATTGFEAPTTTVLMQRKPTENSNGGLATR
jgi:sigma-E factor negative regulatory protein RseA